MSSIIRQLVGDRQQIDVAKAAGLSPVSLNRWYCEHIEPRYIDVVSVAKACGYEVRIVKVGEDNG